MDSSQMKAETNVRSVHPLEDYDPRKTKSQAQLLKSYGDKSVSQCLSNKMRKIW